MVSLTGDHGVGRIPEDMQRTGVDAGLLHLPELQERIEKARGPFHYPKPGIASVNGSDIYFAPGVYDKLQNDHAAMQAVLHAALPQPGVAAVYRSEELRDRPPTQSPALPAFAYIYFPGRSDHLFILPTPYSLLYSPPTTNSPPSATSPPLPPTY